MLGYWLLYLVALPTTLLGGLLVSKRGRRMLKRVRDRQFRKSVKASQAAIKAHRDHKATTARGQLKLQRKQEPPRMTFGHRRKEGDETRTRKAATAISTKAKEAWYQHKVNKANRDSEWSSTGSARVVPTPSGIGSKPSTSGAHISSSTPGTTLCGATTRSGTSCRNPVLNGKRCYAHGGLLR